MGPIHDSSIMNKLFVILPPPDQERDTVIGIMPTSTRLTCPVDTMLWAVYIGRYHIILVEKGLTNEPQMAEHASNMKRGGGYRVLRV